jgi:hypothetical protein
MQPQAQLVPDRHAATGERQDQSSRLVTVAAQSFDEPVTGLFTILENHNTVYPVYYPVYVVVQAFPVCPA